MNTFECVSLIHLPYSLIMWIIDILSDDYIKDNIIQVGILQYFHHLVGIFNFGIIPLLFFSNNITMLVLSIAVSIISQIGWLYNDDLCWMFTYINKKIDPLRPKRKWRAELYSYIKHYIRGDSWAYSDIRSVNMEQCANLQNIFAIACLIKKILNR